MLAIEPFLLQLSPEALHRGIVPAVPFSTHATDKSMLFCQGLIIQRAVLASPVGVQNTAFCALCMVYRGCDDEYAEQVTSEHKINVKTGNGKVRLEWVPKHSHIDNHYLDCECYAMAAADTLGLRGLYLQNVPEKQEQKKSEQYTQEEAWIKENENWV